MASLVLSEQAVHEFVEAHPDQVLYGPTGCFYIPLGNDAWRQVAGGAEPLGILAEHPRRLSLDEMKALFPGSWAPGATLPDATIISTEDMARHVAANRVVTDEAWEARDLLLGQTAHAIDDLDDFVTLATQATFDKLVQAALRQCGVDPGSGSLPMDYYSYDDLRSLFTYVDIQDWLDRKPVNDFMQTENVTHDHDGFVAYMGEKVCETSWWCDAAHDKEMEVVDAVLAKLKGWASDSGGVPSCIEVDFEAMRTQLLETVVYDSVYVDPDIGRAMGSWGDVCVDLFLTDREEWNSDYSNIGLLYEAQQGQDVYEEAVKDALANNGMSWFAEQGGLPRDVMLTATEEDMPGHELYEELLNVSSSTSVMAVFCRLSLDEWIACVEAKEKGEPIVLSGNTFHAGLVDPWNGGGSTLELSLEGPLVIPSDNVLDAAVDPSGHNAPRGPFGDVALVSSKVYGYSVKSIYGMDESLYRSGFINAPVALKQLGLDTKASAAHR